MINSNSNQTVKLVKSLMLKKCRDKSGLFIVEGERFVSDIPNWLEIEFYALSESFSKYNCIFRRDTVKYILSDSVFRGLTDTVNPQGILAVCRKMLLSIDEMFSSTNEGTILVLEEIKDPGNVGTIIRTADAFGVRAVFLSENTVDIYNPKVLRSTMGSIFNIPIFNCMNIDSIISKLKSKNITIYGTSLESENYCWIEKLNKDAAFIIGSEAFGISEKTKKSCDVLLKIPMKGSAQSLNAAVASSIVIYEAFRQNEKVQTNVIVD